MDSRIYCSKKTWPEALALEQFNRVLALPGLAGGRMFPDIHPGRGVPVGAAFQFTGYIYPALIGNDIGCGMSLFLLDTPVRKLKPDKLVRRLGDAPEAVIKAAVDAPDDPMLGTIGHGNHFIEVLAVEKVLDPDCPVKRDSALLLVHCGSRGYGEALWRETAGKHGDQGIPADSEDAKAYLREHQRLIEWADNNRHRVADAVARMLSCTAAEVVSSVHNCIVQTDGGYLHRKGASAVASGDFTVVAGTRGTHSYLVRALPGVKDSLCTISHGAGRKWDRASSKARVREKHRDIQTLVKTPLGTTVVCPNKDLLYEEAPEAYKDIEAVIRDLQEFRLAEPVAVLTPVLNIKP